MVAALSGCISVSLPGVKVSRKATTIPTGLAVVAGVRAALRQLRGELPAIRARLRPLSCGSENCYPAADVTAAAAKIRARLREAIPAEALALRVALESEVAAMTSLDEPVTLDGIQPVSLRAARVGYPTSRIDTFFDRFRKLLDRLEAAPELAPTVSISSEPHGATFELEIPGTEVRKRTYTTNDDVPSVWRSVYQTTVRKDGYRDARYTLDLMNDDRRRLTCVLVRAGDPADSTCRVQ
jgi:hypothetical protein